MATMEQVWGFSTVAMVNTDVGAFLRAMDATAKSRGIEPHVESDALDASRDLILTEAAESLGAWWEIVDGELRVVPTGVTVVWPTD